MRAFGLAEHGPKRLALFGGRYITVGFELVVRELTSHHLLAPRRNLIDIDYIVAAGY